MIKNIETAKTNSFKKYLFILALIFLMLLSAAYFSSYWDFKTLSENILSTENKQKISLENKIGQDNLIKQEDTKISEKQQSELSDQQKAKQISESSFDEKSGQAIKDKTENTSAYQLEYNDRYLTYLKNVDHVIINFFLDLPYSNYLNEIKSNNLPENFKLLIKELEEYDNYLISSPNFKKRIFPKNSGVFEKFIRIDKNLTETTIKTEKKNKIISKLKFWLDYCYSEDFKMKFNNQKS